MNKLIAVLLVAIVILLMMVFLSTWEIGAYATVTGQCLAEMEAAVEMYESAANECDAYDPFLDELFNECLTKLGTCVIRCPN